MDLGGSQEETSYQYTPYRGKLVEQELLYNLNNIV